MKEERTVEGGGRRNHSNSRAKRFISEISSNIKLITLEKCCSIIAFNQILSISTQSFRQDEAHQNVHASALVQSIICYG